MNRFAQFLTVAFIRRSVELLEHISRQYQFNYMQTFRKAALIFVTSAAWGGWHHVEIHPNEWWIQKFESYGFQYSSTLTRQVKLWAGKEGANTTVVAPNGKPFRCGHCAQSMKVFINPGVAALPEHQHLFPHEGCFDRYSSKEEQRQGAGRSITRECGKPGAVETPLPESFKPLSVLPEMHAAWDAAIKKGISLKR